MKIKLEEIAQEILGETMTEAQVIEKYDLDISADDLNDELLDFNIEYCDGCGVWKECFEFNEDAQEPICSECSR